MICPYCKEENVNGAIKCRHCGSWIGTIRDFSKGMEFGKRYIIEQKLGTGGMGVVYKVKDNIRNEWVALKFLPQLYTEDELAVTKLVKEANIAMKLTHDNIARIHNFEEAGGYKFIVMEYIEGKTLRQVLAEAIKKGKGYLPIADIINYTQQICQGLDYAHRKDIIHRDINPSNIMLSHDGIIKITDFGIARILKDTSSGISDETTTGTPPYMSPEQLAGKRTDQKGDIYSLGATLYELLSGEPPFPSEGIEYKILHLKPQELTTKRPDIPEHINKAILKCLEKEPDTRFGNVKELSSELSRDIEQERREKLNQQRFEEEKKRIEHEKRLAEEKHKKEEAERQRKLEEERQKLEEEKKRIEHEKRIDEEKRKREDAERQWRLEEERQRFKEEKKKLEHEKRLAEVKRKQEEAELQRRLKEEREKAAKLVKRKIASIKAMVAVSTIIISLAILIVWLSIQYRQEEPPSTPTVTEMVREKPPEAKPQPAETYQKLGTDGLLVIDDFEKGSLETNGWIVIDKSIAYKGVISPRITNKDKDNWAPHKAYNGKRYLQLYSGPKYGFRKEKISLRKTFSTPNNANELILHYLGVADDTGHGYSRFYLKGIDEKIIHDTNWIKSTKSLTWKEIKFNAKPFQGKNMTLYIELWDDGDAWSGASTCVDYIIFKLSQKKSYKLDRSYKKGALNINSSIKADVYLNGKKVGETPIALNDLSEGEYELKLDIPDYQSWTTKVKVKAGETIKINHIFPAAGSLSVFTNPWAIIYIDGNEKGTTPIIIEKISEGEHLVEIRREGYKPIYKTIIIEAYKTTVESFLLERIN